MTAIYTVQKLRDRLAELPDDAPVMICVVKYPGEFALRPDHSDGGVMRWDTSDDVEVKPLEYEPDEPMEDEVTLQDSGMVYLTVELDEFNPERAQLNGNTNATD